MINFGALLEKKKKKKKIQLQESTCHQEHPTMLFQRARAMRVWALWLRWKQSGEKYERSGRPSFRKQKDMMDTGDEIQINE